MEEAKALYLRCQLDRAFPVFQKYALFPHLNVADNIGFGLNLKKVDKTVISQKVSKMLKMVGLEGFEKRDVTLLSGGQQQRVAIARALVNEPKILLLDEPLGALDAKIRKQMQIELKKIQQEVGITFIYVTHDQSEALSMSDKIVVLKDGIIHQVGTAQEIYFEPKTPFVADFIGTTNLLKLTGSGDGEVRYGNIRIPVSRSVSAGVVYHASIRPECIKLAEKPVEGMVHVPVHIENQRIKICHLHKTGSHPFIYLL